MADDCLIVGGGVIGLSLALELSDHGAIVRVVDAGEPGREASWAGAGILPPAPFRDDDPPLVRLAGLSHQLHPTLAARLREATGIDNGYHRCGGLYVAREAADRAELESEVAFWDAAGIDHCRLDEGELLSREPGLTATDCDGAAAEVVRLPDEAQVRNPRHLKALLAAALRQGVAVEAGAPVEEVVVRRGRAVGVVVGGRTVPAGSVCLTAGAWTGGLGRRLGLRLEVRPVRGQIALLSQPRSPIGQVINEGLRYLVPRTDGRVLVGSTEEEAGFDRNPTATGIEGLLRFACDLVPELAEATLERTWAGLRPATPDGLPYLGAVPEVENLYVAAGHFRSGLQLAPGTAVVVGQIIRGERPTVALTGLGPDRHGTDRAPLASPDEDSATPAAPLPR